MDSHNVWKWLKDEDNRALLQWLGAGAAVVVGGLWTAFTFFYDHDDNNDVVGTNVSAPAGVAAGGDITVGGDLTIGVPHEQVVELARRLGSTEAQLEGVIRQLGPECEAQGEDPCDLVRAVGVLVEKGKNIERSIVLLAETMPGISDVKQRVEAAVDAGQYELAEDLVCGALDLVHGEPSVSDVGSLKFRGAVHLCSVDDRFGGLSGLVVTPDGLNMLSVSDRGLWISAELSYDREGTLIGATKPKLGPLLDLDGQSMETRRAERDAEGITVDRDGAYLVSFERNHRVWRYTGDKENPFESKAEQIILPSAIHDLPANRGIEALTVLPDGRLMMIAEEAKTNGGSVGWIIGGESQFEIVYPSSDGFRPSDMTTMPNGSVLVLERKFSILDGLEIRIMEITSANPTPGERLEVREIATLSVPMLVDNFEGIAGGQGPDGSFYLYLISDNNFNLIQRTILVQFLMKD